MIHYQTQSQTPHHISLTSYITFFTKTTARLPGSIVD